jgi:glycosyltransferase involved in cell wall biosynthesis
MSWVDGFQNADHHSIPEAVVRRPVIDRVPCTAGELELPECMDGDGALVSVVLPTYQDSRFLADALESVGAQTHQNLELIIVDSSRVSWVEQVADDREWITYIGQKPRGLPNARNDGIEVASGKYVALLDADDYWHPEKLDRQLEQLESGAVLSYTAVYRTDIGDGELAVTCRDVTPPSERPVRDRLTGRITMNPSTVVFRRSAVSDRPFNETLVAAEDLVFVIELCRENQPAHIADPLAVYRNHKASMTADNELMFEGGLRALDVISRQFPDLRPLIKRVRASLHCSQGRHQLIAGNRIAARERLHESLRLGGLDKRTLGLYVATFTPFDEQRTVDVLRKVRDVLRALPLGN